MSMMVLTMLPFVLLVIIGVVFWLSMLISCLVRDYRDFGTIIPSDPAADKVLWLVIILFTSVIGAIAYHISIRRRVRQPAAPAPQAPVTPPAGTSVSADAV